MEKYSKLVEKISLVHINKPNKLEGSDYEISDILKYYWHFGELLGHLSTITLEDRKILEEGNSKLLQGFTQDREAYLFKHYFSLSDWAQTQEILFVRVMTSISAFATNRGLFLPSHWGALLEDYMIEKNTFDIKPHLFNVSEDLVLRYSIRKTAEYEDKITEFKEDEKYEENYVRYILLDYVINKEIDVSALNGKQKKRLIASIIKAKDRSITNYNKQKVEENSGSPSILKQRADKLIKNIKKGNLM